MSEYTQGFPRPNLFTEVEWGPLPSAIDYQRAYNAWSLPNETLAPQDLVASGNPQRADDLEVVQEVLVRHIMERIRLKAHGSGTAIQQIEAVDPDAQQRKGNGPGWAYSDFLIDTCVAAQPPPTSIEDATYNGKRIMDPKSFTVKELKLALGNDDDIPPKTPKAGLQRMLAERESQRAPARLDAAHSDLNLLPNADLSDWGMPQDDPFRLPFRTDRPYTAADLYTWAVHCSPYNPTYWLSRAFHLYQKGLYDLALGDGYRAMYLIEVVVDVSKRAKRPGLYVRVWDALEQHLLRQPNKTALEYLTKDQGVPFFLGPVRKAVHHVLSLSLVGCGAYVDAQAMDNYLLKRVIMPQKERRLFERRQKSLVDQIVKLKSRRMSFKDRLLSHERSVGYHGRVDLANAGQPGVVAWLNEGLIPRCAPNRSDGPLIRVEVDQRAGRSGYGLKVVATRRIERNEVIHVEDPSIRGHLQSVYAGPKAEMSGVLRDLAQADRSLTATDDGDGQGYFCELCKRSIDSDSIRARRILYASLKTHNQPTNNLPITCGCLFQDPMMLFCFEDYDGARTQKNRRVRAARRVRAQPKRERLAGLAKQHREQKQQQERLLKQQQQHQHHLWAERIAAEMRHVAEGEQRRDQHLEILRQFEKKRRAGEDTGNEADDAPKRPRLQDQQGTDPTSPGYGPPSRDSTPHQAPQGEPTATSPTISPRPGPPSARHYGPPSSEYSPKETMDSEVAALAPSLVHNHGTEPVTGSDQGTGAAPVEEAVGEDANVKVERDVADEASEGLGPSHLSLRGGAGTSRARRMIRKKGPSKKHAPEDTASKGETATTVQGQPSDQTGTVPPEPERAQDEGETCLQIARKIFHYKACGRDWHWLHKLMKHRNMDLNGWTWHERSAPLSLLLREVFDMALKKQEAEGGKAHILAFEIEPLLPLCDGDESDTKRGRLPFSWASNIVVPFDILETLGVNMFRNLDFDTWVIQAVLQKLAFNCLPWDHSNQDMWAGEGTSQAARNDPDGPSLSESTDHRTTDLYIYTGYNLFKQACYATAEAYWTCEDHNSGKPNRIVVKARKPIEEGQEIRVLHLPPMLSREPVELDDNTVRRFVGRDCDCSRCTEGGNVIHGPYN